MPRTFIPTAQKPALIPQESLDYSRGYNSFTANDLVPQNQLVYATDTRISTLGRQKTRKGCDFYTVPAGEAQVDSQTSAVGVASQSFSVTSYQAARIVPSSSGRITKVDINIKNAASATGDIYVEIYSDATGSPGTLLAQSSIPASALTSSFVYYSARFIEAPLVVNLTPYWIVARVQTGGTGSYTWASTTAAATSKSSVNSGVTWQTTSYALNFQVSVAPDSPVLGHFRAYKSDGSRKTLMAHGTSVYTVADNTGDLTSIASGFATTATRYEFAESEDVVYYVNGTDVPHKWNFTTDSVVAGAVRARFIVLHKNRMYYADASDPTRVFFSGAGAGQFETFASTDFFYVPSPKSPDPITKMVSLNDNLIIFTSRTKWVLSGSDISTIVLRQASGIKGTVAPDSVQVTRNHAYFASDDGFYRFNGGTDELLSLDITNEYLAATNRTNMGSGLTGSRYYLSFTPAGEAVNSKTWVYNINYGSVESMDRGTFVQKTTVWNGATDSGQYVQGSNLVGALYYAELESNTYNNLGRAMKWELRTKYDHFGQPASDKQVKRWYPRFATSAGNYAVECQYDKDFSNSPATISIPLIGTGSLWGSGKLWGTGQMWGTSVLVEPRLTIPGRSPYTQIRYKREGVNQPVEFYGQSLFYSIRRPR